MRLAISDRRVVCIDWDERSLRVLDVNCSRSSVRVHTAVHVPIAPGTSARDPASMGDFIRRTLGEHRIRTRRAIVDIPRQDAVLNLLSLPDGTTDELTAMVHIQVAKELPFAKDQAVIDFVVSREAGSSACDVWVAAVRNHIADYYQEVMLSAGLKLERIGFRSYANRAALLAGGEVEGRTVTVDVGPSMTEINVIHQGRLVYSRAASVSVPAGGLCEPVDPRGALEDGGASDRTIPLMEDSLPLPVPIDILLIEVSRTIEAYRATAPGATIDRIVLSGSAVVDAKVCEVFTARFDKPAAVFEVPKSIHWRRGLDVSAAPFSAAIGLALGHVAGELDHFDFLHPKEPEAGRRERARRIPQIAAAAAVFVVLIGWVAYRPIRALNAEIDALETEIENTGGGKEGATARKVFLDKDKDLQAWLDESVIWLDVLDQLGKVFPSNEQGYITKLECTKDGAIDLALAVKDRKVCTGLSEEAEKVKALRRTGKGEIEESSEQLFKAEIHGVTPSNDPEYKWKDGLRLQIRSVQDVGR